MRGAATIAGHDLINEPEAVRRSIGFLSGTTGLYARLTPRETLRFFGAMYGWSIIDCMKAVTHAPGSLLLEATVRSIWARTPLASSGDSMRNSGLASPTCAARVRTIVDSSPTC